MNELYPSKRARLIDGWLVGALLLGLALRFHYLYVADFVIDADEAIVGLMGKHILEGGEIPIFYYGQHYMGSFEALCAALSFAIFGVTSFALKLVPLLFSVALIAVVYQIGLRVGGRVAARFAALFFAIPPAALLLWSSMARGGFIELVFIGALALLLAIDWLKLEHPSFKLTLLIGILLGFGWWVNNQIVFFILPIGLFFFLRLIKRSFGETLSHGAVGSIGFFLGGLPFWVYNLQNNFASFGMFKRASLSQMKDHLIGVFDLSLPILFGAKRFWNEDALLSVSVWVMYLTFGVVLLVLLRKCRQTSVNLLLCFVAGAILIFAVSSFGYLVQAPRYLLPIYVGVYVLCGAALGYLWTSRAGKPVALLLCGAILFLNLTSSYKGGVAVAGEPFVFDQQRVSRDHSELVEWLKKEGYSFVRTNYWIGYRLAFETKEEIKFRVFQAPRQIRIESYELESEGFSDKSLPFVLVPAQAKRIKSALESLGYEFRENFLSSYSVIDQIRPRYGEGQPVPKEFLLPSSAYRPDAAASAIDSNLETRWGTGAPQHSAMTFEIAIKGPSEGSRILRGFEYSLGDWYHDYPRGLRVEREVLGKGMEEVCAVPNYEDLRYLLDGQSRFSCYFEPKPTDRLILYQTGSDPVFDWTIAEITLMR